MNYVWLDPVGHGVRRQPQWCSQLESTWCYVVFGSNLGNLHRGGELWGEGKNYVESFLNFVED